MHFSEIGKVIEVLGKDRGIEKEVVIKALDAVHGMRGGLYLEKIVQAPFELPLPDKVALRGLLTDQLDEILMGTPDDLFDASRWQRVFSEGIDDYIQTYIASFLSVT